MRGESLLAEVRAIATETEAVQFFRNLRVLPADMTEVDAAAVKALWQAACSWSYRGLSVGDREFVRAVVREQRAIGSCVNKATMIRRDGLWSMASPTTFDRLRPRWQILDDAYRGLFWPGIKGSGPESIVDDIWHSRHIPEGGDQRTWLPTTEAEIEAERAHKAAARTKRMTAQLDKRCGTLIAPGFMAWIGWVHRGRSQYVWSRRTVPTCTVGGYEAILSTRPGFMARVVPLGLAAPPCSSRVYPLGLDATRDMGNGVCLAEGWWVTRSHRHAPPTRGWMAWSYEPDGSGRVEVLVSGRTAEQALRDFWARFGELHGNATPADRALAWCPEPPPEVDDMSDEDLEAFAGLAA